jgi:hypothetical protein
MVCWGARGNDASETPRLSYRVKKGKGPCSGRTQWPSTRRGSSDTPRPARWRAPCNRCAHGLGLHCLRWYPVVLRRASSVAAGRSPLAARGNHDQGAGSPAAAATRTVESSSGVSRLTYFAAGKPALTASATGAGATRCRCVHLMRNRLFRDGDRYVLVREQRAVAGDAAQHVRARLAEDDIRGIATVRRRFGNDVRR